MDTNLKHFAKNFYKNVKAVDVIKEAIMNAIQSQATEINIYMNYVYQDNTAIEGDKNSLSELIIEDNGVGFIEENRTAFMELCTEHKKQVGGKGVGRISFLKYANKINIESFSGQEKITLNFSYDSELEDFQIFSYDSELEDFQITKKSCKKNTKITFTDINDNINTKLDSIYDNLKSHFALFIYLNAKDKEININIYKNTKLEKSIKSKDFTAIKNLSFESNNVNFEIDIFKNKDDKNIDMYLCADGIPVEKIPISKFDTQYICAVSSSFLNQIADTERKKFNYTDLFDEVPHETFKADIKTYIINNIKDLEPDLLEKNKLKIEKLKSSYGYMNFDNLDENSLYLSEKEMLDSQRQIEIKKEENVVRLLNSDNSTLEEFVASVKEVNKTELARYIFHRNLILDKFDDLISNGNAKEDILHNLFFPKVKGERNLYTNNIWSLDDKFMSYTFGYSDEAIKKIKQDIKANNPSEYGELKEPDIVLLYSNESKEGYKDVVIWELKALDVSSDRKLISITELNRNLMHVAKHIPKINNMWGYIITTLDEKTQEDLIGQNGVKKLFTNGDEPMYYYYNENIEIDNRKIPAHIYILSMPSIVKDARARNKTFLDILKNQSKG